MSYVHVGLALVAVAATFLLAALVYKILAFKQISYGRTLLVQIAANFINRLLPAGIGGIGANYRYLRRQKHSAAQAATVVAVNNGLGLVGHAVLIVGLIAITSANAVPFRVSRRTELVAACTGAILIALFTFVPQLRYRLRHALQLFIGQLTLYQRRPQLLAAALALQICLTLSNVTAFWLCAMALHASISFVAALLIFTLGVSIGNATPTPGGLGGIEAGLVAGLVAYHLASPTALAVVLVYRLLSYWLPIALSAPVFVYARRRQYF